jgi:hypothetical protein
MSFWKKMFGKSNQEVSEENLTIEDHVEEAQLEVESSDTPEDQVASKKRLAIVIDTIVIHMLSG